MLAPRRSSRNRTSGWSTVREYDFEFVSDTPRLLQRPKPSSRRVLAPFAATLLKNAGAAPGGKEQPRRGGDSQRQVLPVFKQEVAGRRRKVYVWDGKRLRAVHPEDLEEDEATHQQASNQQQQQHQGGSGFGPGFGLGASPGTRKLRIALQRLQHGVRVSFLPSIRDVTPDYWGYARWRAMHRLFSSMSGVFATQSMLLAVGVGAKRALPTAAAINWVLKDGLGRLGRLTVATQWGRSFDSDLKRFRFATSLLYCGCSALEYLTPYCPGQFLLMASLANVGKSIGLTTFIATEPAFQRSFCRKENMADINAKTQAQQMVMDNVGLALAVAVTKASERLSPLARMRLPLALFPLMAAGDITSIYLQLKAIHLRTLNKERTEIIVDHWLRNGRVPTPLEVSKEETLLRPPALAAGRLPLQIVPLEEAVDTPSQLLTQLDLYRKERYVLTLQEDCCGGMCGAGGACSRSCHEGSASTTSGGKWWWWWRRRRRRDSIAVTLREDAGAEDTVQAVLQAGHVRRMLRGAEQQQQQRKGPPDGGGGKSPSGATTAAGVGSAPPPGSGRWWQRKRSRASSNDGGGGGGGRDGGGGGGGRNGGGREDSERCLQRARSLARREVGGLLSQLRGQGWQVDPFMLSRSEREGYSL